ncbi:transposase [Candidatus Accumulibacter sp. ACC003]|uniref:transposase n=1 Tax=Candidatus Accumulibacter sp. ACC003 TaxID=2823334 RepID=UPI0025B8929E|nr:transposase [Candidatus Accumulibacter sp. ACC003]
MITLSHEITLLRDYDQSEQAMTRHKDALWLVDRAFIDAAFWDSRKKRLGVTLITRMKSSLCIDSTEPLPVADLPANEGVLKDLRITLRSSRQDWRLITFRSRRGHLVEFLTNEFKLEPGLIAFLYSRRWEEEKCFDTWKNDFSQAKAWGASVAAIENQVRLALTLSGTDPLLLTKADPSSVTQ